MTRTLPPPSATSAAPARGARRGVGRRRAVAVLALAFTVVVLLGLVPGFVGSAVSTALPWLGLLLVPLLVAALAVRGRTWLVALVPAIAWAFAVGPSFAWLPAPDGDGAAVAADAADAPAELVFASQNVEALSGTAADSATTLVAAGADVIALTELEGDAREQADAALEASHPYTYAVGTVGIWSTSPISNARPLELGLGWNRALTVDISAPAGLVSVYVVHAASLRPGAQSDRDTMLDELAAVIDRDENERVVALGDFNAASTDPALTGIRRTLSEPGQSEPSFGFTWPAAFPVARIDHLFQRGLTPVENTVLPAGASDHLAVLTTLRY
ncbi:endonuclease/exonuclease/phosphatase family protein [Agromyces soli]|uniref:Endonuclease/exonuclease/phosphatase family protein n=1 Tax=Agromyces soli TaxID=659012 RepID=A0ABY4ATS9_9MICO|nr:endonuclease/exonuclease/phosphatase family protein [Agromyces soli]UOE26575.1 endonuclease/exonuclease/phosphatase family protein [Agromyces soli]